MGKHQQLASADDIETFLIVSFSLVPDLQLTMILISYSGLLEAKSGMPFISVLSKVLSFVSTSASSASRQPS